MKKIMLNAFALTLFLILILIGSVSSVLACNNEDFNNAIKATPQTITIGADGSINPTNTPITCSGNTYTFTDNIYAPLVVQKDNVVINGAGHILQGPYNGTQTNLWLIGVGSNQSSTNQTTIPWTVGIDLPIGSCNLTVENLNIQNFSIGLYLWTSNNTIIGNAISENLVGVLLSGPDNTLTKNYIANNSIGIFFGANQGDVIPANITLSGNGFVDNTRHMSGCVCADFNSSEATHTWDNGKTGNYWSGYNGTASNKDGIGNTPYVIDVLNQDRYPLMRDPAAPPTVAPQIPFELIVPIVGLTVILFLAYFRQKRKLKKKS